jgi:hypothetical protein
VRIVRLSTIALLEQNLRTKNTSQRPRLTAEESLRVFCQLLQLSKSFGLGYRPRAFRAWRSVRISRTEIKNPASSAGPIRLHTVRKRLRAMLDSVLSGIRNWPHSEPTGVAR